MKSTVIAGFVVLMCILIVVTAVMFGVSIGSSLVNKTEFTQDTYSGWIAAGATLAITILTVVLAWETHAMRILQQQQMKGLRADAIKPDIDIHLQTIGTMSNLLDIVVRNSGNGVARNINTNILHVDGYGDSKIASEIIDELNKRAIMSYGISTLGPRRERRSFALHMLDYKDDILDIRLEVKTTCIDDDGTEHPFISTIDFGEYRGTGSLEIKTTHDIAKALNKIVKDGLTVKLSELQSEDDN